MKIAALAIILAQSAQPMAAENKWCFDRGQGTQLCEETEKECNHLHDINPDIARGPCRVVEQPDVKTSPPNPVPTPTMK